MCPLHTVVFPRARKACIKCIYQCYRLEATERSLRRARGSILGEVDADDLLQSFTDLLDEFRKEDANAHNTDESK